MGAWKSTWRVWSPDKWVAWKMRPSGQMGRGFASVSLHPHSPVRFKEGRWCCDSQHHLPIMHQRGCPYQNICQCDLQRNSEHGWISWLFPLTDIFFPLLPFLSFISFLFRCFPWTKVDVISITKKKKKKSEFNVCLSGSFGFLCSREDILFI